MDCLKQVSVENNNKNNVIESESVLNQLIKNVHITQSKRQQIIKNHHHHKSTTFSQAHYHLKTTNINDKENPNKDINDPTGIIKHENYRKNDESVQKSNKTDTINKSHHHPQSLLPSQCSVSSQPYLNIQEQYVYPSSIVVHNKNAQISQDNPSRNELNNCSIQLSQSVQESQEILLHHSVSSKFLQSPTLSLGLIESKITKKSTLSHVDINKNTQDTKDNVQNVKNNKCQQNMNGENKMNQNGKILNQNQIKGKQNKKQNKKKINKQTSMQNLMFFSINDDEISQVKNIQTQENNQKLRDKQITLKEKINKLIEKQQSTATATVLQTNHHIPTIISDKDLNNEIISSYQMQIEYLRKINLIQSMEIQKLRKLVRLSTKENLSYQNSNINLNENDNNNKDKDKDFRSKKIVVDNNILMKPQQLHLLDSNIKINNEMNTTSRNHNHNQFLIIDSHSQIPFHEQNTHNNKCISQTTNTKITSTNSVHSIDQTQDLFQNYIKNNHYHHKHEHIPSKKTLSKQVNNKSIHLNQSMRSSLLNSKNIKDNNKHRVSLNDMDINSTLSFNNKHNLSYNNQSTCKKLKSNKKSKKLGSSSCQRQVMSLTKQIRNKQNKQNQEPKTLSMKKKDYNNKGKKKKAICSVDLLESIKKQLYNQERRK